MSVSNRASGGLQFGALRSTVNISFVLAGGLPRDYSERPPSPGGPSRSLLPPRGATEAPIPARRRSGKNRRHCCGQGCRSRRCRVPVRAAQSGHWPNCRIAAPWFAEPLVRARRCISSPAPLQSFGPGDPAFPSSPDGCRRRPISRARPKAPPIPPAQLHPARR